MELAAVILFLCACAASYAVQTVTFAHMLQLNSYRPERFAKWRRDHFTDVIVAYRRLPPLAGAGVLLAFGLTGTIAPDSGIPAWLGPLLAAALFALTAGLCFPRKAKKPLVCTARVKRLFVTAGGLFLLLAGGLLLSLRWLPLWPGAAALALLLTPVWMWTALANRLNQPIEKAVANRYIRDARRILAGRPDLIVVGITGSYGKTSAKNFLHALLGAKYNVLMTPESYNTTLGVVRTIREQLQPHHEVFIVEMGAKNPGDIREICDLVHPRYGILTSIGEQHLETFHTIDNIIRTKFELPESLPPEGCAFLNYDNEYIRAHGFTGRAVTYGTAPQAQAGYTGALVSLGPEGCVFTVTDPSGETQTFATRLLGAHNIQNLTGCIACAHTLGVPLADMAYPLRLLRPVAHRLQLLPGGFIDDAYNSNPAGFRAALDVLGGFPGLRVLVTPGMVELGDRQEALNRELGAYAAGHCDYAILVGGKQAPPLQAGLADAGFPRERVYVAGDLREALIHLDTLPAPQGRTVLLENDLPDNF